MNLIVEEVIATMGQEVQNEELALSTDVGKGAIKLTELNEGEGQRHSGDEQQHSGDEVAEGEGGPSTEGKTKANRGRRVPRPRLRNPRSMPDIRKSLLLLYKKAQQPVWKVNPRNISKRQMLQAKICLQDTLVQVLDHVHEKKGSHTKVVEIILGNGGSILDSLASQFISRTVGLKQRLSRCT